MDEIFDKLEGGEAAMGVYYAGDYLTMYENNPDLAFVVPRGGHQPLRGRHVHSHQGCAQSGERRDVHQLHVLHPSGPEKLRGDLVLHSPALRAEGVGRRGGGRSLRATRIRTSWITSARLFACLPAQIRTLYNDQWVRLMNN